MSFRARASLALASLTLAAVSHGAPRPFQKMMRNEDVGRLRVGERVRPRFSRQVIRQDTPLVLGGRTLSSGGEAEALMARTLDGLKRAGLIPRAQPGRTEGVFVARDLARFPEFLADPTRTRVHLEPVDPRRVATYDRRHFLTVLRALDRAQAATTLPEAERQVARATQAARRYYLEPPRPGDLRAQPETLLGGGGTVVKIDRR